MSDQNSPKKEVTILLVEDDLGHARLIEKSLRRANITNPIVNVRDGQSALDYLFEGNGKAKEDNSTLVLLDLNMPILDGYEVLKRMKADPRTRRIPVVVLTTTSDAREVAKCYELGCNVYVTKPVDYVNFTEAVRKLGLFLSVVSIPDRGATE